MDDENRKRLEAAGWKFGTPDEFLGEISRATDPRDVAGMDREFVARAYELASAYQLYSKAVWEYLEREATDDKGVERHAMCRLGNAFCYAQECLDAIKRRFNFTQMSAIATEVFTSGESPGAQFFDDEHNAK